MASMKKTALHSSTFRDIRGSLGRFFAIFAIIGLGVGFFSGVRITTPVMVNTFDLFYKEKNFFDYRLVSTIGWEEQDVEAVRKEPGVISAEGSFSYDVICLGADQSDEVYKALLLPDKVNQLELTEGRLPKNADEVLMDNRNRSELKLGDQLVFSGSNQEEQLEHFNGTSFRIVGFADSSLYINFERGTTSLGNGQVSGFLYFTRDVFASDIYTEIYVDMDVEGEIYSEEYDDRMDQLRSGWEKTVDRLVEERRNRIYEDAVKKLEDGREELTAEKEKNQKKLDDGKKELEEAAKKLEDSEQELADGEVKLAEGKETLEQSEKELADAKKKLEDAKKQLDSGKAELDRNRKKLEDAQKELDAKNPELKAGKQKLEEAKKKLDQTKKMLDVLQPTVDDLKERVEAAERAREVIREQLEAGMSDTAKIIMDVTFRGAQEAHERAMAEYEKALQQFESGKKQYEAGVVEYEKGLKEYQAGAAKYEAALAQINDGWAQYRKGEERYQAGLAQYRSGYAKYEAGLKQFEEGKEEYENGIKELEDGRKQLEDGRKKYEKGLQEYEDGKKEFEEKILEAEDKLAEGEKELERLEDPEAFLLERNSNIGYSCFSNDSEIVGQVAKVFPVFFILVAALVCMTTMTRMVEEQRGQIGILKALGYSNRDIALKYTAYSGSASILGCVIGYGVGIILFPSVIWITYNLMYISQSLKFIVDWKLALIAFLASVACSVGITLISCRYELRETAAGLMRPKAPKPGKRVFLERIPAIWNRLKFLHKVSIRNIFRYKGRFFMMLLGIGGSTALLITGFGIKDSIAGFSETQFEEIQTADVEMNFREGRGKRAPEELAELLEKDSESYILGYTGSWDLIHEKTVKSINLIVPDDGKDFTPFFHLYDLDGNALSVPKKGEILIGAAIADRCHLSVGDTITLRSSDLTEVTVKVSGVFRSHIYNYVIASPEDISWSVNTAYVIFPEGSDIYREQAAFAALEDVSYVNVYKDFKERMTSMMSRLDYIVLIVVLSAAGLALVVLYNLTNINITERIREIATIKVLGFYPNETGQYVFRENFLLTFFGMVVGLGLGALLHRYVMSQIVVDMVYFNIVVKPLSFLYSVLLTFVFTFLVNLLMRTKLERINMAESLKSVE